MEEDNPNQATVVTSSESSQMEDDSAPAIFEQDEAPQFNPFAFAQVVEPGAQYQISIDGQEPVFMAIGSFEETKWTPATPGVLKTQISRFLEKFFTVKPFNLQIMICEDQDDEDHVKVTDDGLHFMKCAQTKDTILSVFPEKDTLKNHVFSIRAAKLDDLTAEGDLHLEFDPQHVKCDLVSRLATDTSAMVNLFDLPEVRLLLENYTQGVVAQVIPQGTDLSEHEGLQQDGDDELSENSLGKRSALKPMPADPTPPPPLEDPARPPSPLKLSLCNLSSFSVFGKTKMPIQLTVQSTEAGLSTHSAKLVSPEKPATSHQPKIIQEGRSEDKTQPMSVSEERPAETQPAKLAPLPAQQPKSPQKPAQVPWSVAIDGETEPQAQTRPIVPAAEPSEHPTEDRIAHKQTNLQKPQQHLQVDEEDELSLDFDDFLVFTDEDMFAIDDLHRQNMLCAKEIDELFLSNTQSFSILTEEDSDLVAEFHQKTLAEAQKVAQLAALEQDLLMESLAQAVREFEDKIIDSAERILHRPYIQVVDPANPIELTNHFKLVPEPQQAPEKSIAEWKSLMEAEFAGVGQTLIVAEPEPVESSLRVEDRDGVQEVSKAAHLTGTDDSLSKLPTAIKEPAQADSLKDIQVGNLRSVASSSKKLPPASEGNTITSIVENFLNNTEKPPDHSDDQVKEIPRVQSTSSHRDIRRAGSGVTSPRERSARNFDIPPVVIADPVPADPASAMTGRRDIMVDSDSVENEVSTPSQLSNNPNNSAVQQVVEVELVVQSPAKPVPQPETDQESRKKLASALEEIDKLIPTTIAAATWSLLLGSGNPLR